MKTMFGFFVMLEPSPQASESRPRSAASPRTGTASRRACSRPRTWRWPRRPSWPLLQLICRRLRWRRLPSGQKQTAVANTRPLPGYAAGESLCCHRPSCVGLVLAGELVEGCLGGVDDHLDDLAGERERGFVEVRDRRAGVTADVEGFVGGEVAGHLLVKTAFPDCRRSDPKGDISTRAEFVLLVDRYFGGKNLTPRWDWLRGCDAVVNFVVVVVLPMKVAVLDE